MSRISEIRERRAKEYGHSFTGTRGTDAMMSDIDFLLSLVKSQEAQLDGYKRLLDSAEDHNERLLDATNSIRSACVEKLRERAKRYQKLADDSLPNDQTAARTAAAAAALNSAAKELESVSIHRSRRNELRYQVSRHSH